MFTIIGGDGQEYGPVNAQQIRAWLAAGRANLETRAQRVGDTEWQTLGEFAEFAAPADLPPLLNDTEANAPLAPLWRRLLGALVDGLLEVLCWLPTSTALMHVMIEMTKEGTPPDPTELMTSFWQAVPASLPYLGGLLFVQIVLLTWRSQSVGNLLTGTQIVRVGDEAPGGFLRAFLLRGFLARVFRHFPLIGPVFWLVDTCFIFRADHRCLHDLIAGTKVIKR